MGEARIFRTFVIAVVGFIAGAVITYGLVVFGTLLVWDMLGTHDQDGGGAMALGLIIGPFCAIIGGIAGAVLLPILIARRTRNAPAASEGSAERDRRRFAILIGAIIGGFVGHYAAQFGIWLARPITFDSYWKVWMVTWLPTLVTLAGAAGGGVLARMLSRPA